MNQSPNQQGSHAARLGKIAANWERLRKLAGRCVDALLPTLPQVGRPRLRPVLVRPQLRRRDR
jgi:hypothetical protein